MNILQIKLTNEEIESLLRINKENLSLNDLVVKIVKEKISFLFLDYGYYYNLSSKDLFNSNGMRVEFTKIERKLFNYLILRSLKNNSFYVDVDIIKKDVWKNEETTIYSIRNKINSIRVKTYDRIIRNKTNHGYRINIYVSKPEEETELLNA